jgi:hypothetical protein
MNNKIRHLKGRICWISRREIEDSKSKNKYSQEPRMQMIIWYISYRPTGGSTKLSIHTFFSSVALSVPSTFQCKISEFFVFHVVCFLPLVSFLVLPRDKRELVISVSPAFAWPWKNTCDEESWSTCATSIRKGSVVHFLINLKLSVSYCR